MPRYRTTIWVEATVQTLEVVEIEAPTLEDAQAFAQNPNNRPDGVSIEDFIDSIDTYYGDSTGYYETSDGEVTPVLEEPSVMIPGTRAYSTQSTCTGITVDDYVLSYQISPTTITGKVIPKGFTLKEYKIKDTNENLCDF